MPLEKKLNLEMSETSQFDYQPTQASQQTDVEKLLELYSPHVVDKNELRDRIKQLLELKQQVSLKEVIDKYPLEKGLSELLAYFSLAAGNHNHIFNPGKIETIEFNPKYRKYIEIPQIIFTR